jgi:hypothetical protein
MPGPMMNIPSAAMPMVGPAPSVEDQAKMMFSQRAAQTMVQAANQDAAFQQQLAATKYARARAKVIQLPANEAYGMTEGGSPIRDKKPTGRVWLPGDKPNPTASAESIAKYGARPQDFAGMGFDDIANTVDSIPTQVELADLNHRDAQRGAAHGRAGTLPAFIPADGVLSESDNLPRDNPNVQLPLAQPGTYRGAPTAGAPTPGTAAHPVERMFGHLDDTVAQGGYQALMEQHPDNFISALAHQLEAQRMRKMGAWDPSAVSGGTY